MSVRELTREQAQTIITNAGAQHTRTVGTAMTYVSTRERVTITLFPGSRPGLLKVQIVSGCTC